MSSGEEVYYANIELGISITKYKIYTALLQVAPLHLHGEQDRQGWCHRDSAHVQLPRSELQHPLLPDLDDDSVPGVSLPGPGCTPVL